MRNVKKKKMKWTEITTGIGFLIVLFGSLLADSNLYIAFILLAIGLGILLITIIGGNK